MKVLIFGEQNIVTALSEKFRNAGRELERRLKYSFRDFSLLESSLHHHAAGLSDMDRTSRRDRAYFERNEKLGDGLLKVVTQNLLATRYPGIGAGELTRRESVITCNDNLAHLALRLQIPRFFNETGLLEYRRKALADTVEALFHAIALDAGSGDELFGLPELRRVCERLLEVELATCQIPTPFFQLQRVARGLREEIKLQYKTTYYKNVVAGFVAKINFGRKISKQIGVSSFCGTGFTAEAAREKAAAMVLLALQPTQFPSYIKSLVGFSWRIAAV